MAKPAHKFEVAVVRYEEYVGQYESWRVLERFTTYAVSVNQALNNIRYRIGGEKNLAFIDGSDHTLMDRIQIAPKDNHGYVYDFRHTIGSEVAQ